MEDKLSEEQRLREEEQQRLRELEAIKRELERLLEEERQAKKDEEIVRNLQARYVIVLVTSGSGLETTTILHISIYKCIQTYGINI